MENGIFKAISAVMRKIEPIKKARKNSAQGYMFRGVDDAMNEIGPVMAGEGIFITTDKIEALANETVTSKNGGSGYRVKNRYHFAFNAEDGSRVVVVSEGEAIDYGDKATNKAHSVAYREAIFKTFCVPFEGDDIENHEHELKSAHKSNTKPQAEAPAPANPQSDAPISLNTAAAQTERDRVQAFIDKVLAIKSLVGCSKAREAMGKAGFDDKNLSIIAVTLKGIEMRLKKDAELQLTESPEGEPK